MDGRRSSCPAARGPSLGLVHTVVDISTLRLADDEGAAADRAVPPCPRGQPQSLVPSQRLSFVPANVPGAQETVLKWAGVDTDQIPDHIWVSPAGDCQ